jgi:DNA helicase IV
MIDNNEISSRNHDISLQQLTNLHSNSSMIADEIVDENDAALTLRGREEDFEARIEARLSRIQEENNILKRMCLESHNNNTQMKSVLQSVVGTLYNVFKINPSLSNNIEKNNHLQRTSVSFIFKLLYAI